MHNCASKQVKESPMNKPAHEVRREVSQAYAERVTQPAAGGCCGSAATAKAKVAALSGYSAEELAPVPSDAAVHSFGCGNPLAMAGVRAGDVVLDLGSGAGIDLFLAAEKVGAAGRVIGVDMTDEMLAKARENIRAGGYTNVEVRKGIIEELPVENSSVDWVISNCVINLSPEKPRVFREIARVLKPGGRMLVSDIVAENLPQELLSIPALHAACVAGAISEQEYLGGLRAAGLADVEVRARLVYDPDQLVAIAEDLATAPGGGAAACGCIAQLGPEARALAETLAGKIWSARIYARKPLASTC
jgi:arsenite methyltransferase